MALYGIDISYWQRGNYKKLIDAYGTDFVIARAAFNKHVDEYCEKIYNTSWAMLDVREGTMMANNVVFGDCKGAVGVADGTVGVYLCNCYLKGTPSVRFAFGSLANRTSKIHTNSTCSNITIT